MKKTSAFLGYSLALTVTFYLLSYYLLPPPPPSAAVMVLFAGISMALVWIAQCLMRRFSSGEQKDGKKPAPKVELLLLAAVLTGLVMLPVGCGKAAAPPDQGNGASSPPPQPEAPPPPPPAAVPLPEAVPPPAAVPPPRDGKDSILPPKHHVNLGSGGRPDINLGTTGSVLPRVTGTALLVAGGKEEAGYGLYSYALLEHPPSDDEKLKYQAFFKALIGLPEASQLGQYLPKSRINVTYLPVQSIPEDWEALSADKRVDYVLAHYDYARSAAMLSSLNHPVGQGPVILSLLTPINLQEHPHPVLVQDLSKAQVALVGSYVDEFVQQAAKDRFWQESELEKFSLSLRNLLEVAATGIGMSKTAVQDWVKFFQ